MIPRPRSGMKREIDTIMAQDLSPAGPPERQPSGKSPGFDTSAREVIATTDFFSGTGEPHANQYDKKSAFRDRLKLFVESVQRTTPLPAKVLDFGCGPGNISMSLARLGYDVLGLDGAEGMISVSRRRSSELNVPALRFERIDAEHFDPSCGPFDAVVCSSVLEYIPDDLELLNKLILSLRPGGCLSVSVPHRGNVFSPLEPVAHYIKLRLSGRTEGHLSHTLHHYDRQLFSKQLEQMGIENLRCTSFECPVLGPLGIKLSRWPVFSRMFLFEGRRAAPRRAPVISSSGKLRKPTLLMNNIKYRIKEDVWRKLSVVSPMCYEHLRSGAVTTGFLDGFDATKSIFIHVPKTAGISFGVALYGRKVSHRSWRYYWKLNRRKFETYFKFAVVREPVSRFSSAFDFLKAGGIDKHELPFAEVILKPFSDANALAHALSDQKLRDQILAKEHFRNQADFIADERGNSMVDLLIPFDRVQQGFELVAKKLNRPNSKLSHLNKTPNRKEVTFDPKAMEVLRGIYQQDFVLWEKARTTDLSETVRRTAAAKA
jgi:2-polyprenyl-3-methyl-5-hydroxy-6-metoxy-1,4-benzoquinol methylase